MDAKEVIVAQAVANAELMAERDSLRNECIRLQQEVAKYDEEAKSAKSASKEA